jgi:hypothetical protein
VFLPHSSHALPTAGPSKLLIEKPKERFGERRQVTVSRVVSWRPVRTKMMTDLMVEWNISVPESI